ncbi:MAG: hypothetical protein ABSC56_10345 [Solirubrobacteraceae bacterium]
MPLGAGAPLGAVTVTEQDIVPSIPAALPASGHYTEVVDAGTGDGGGGAGAGILPKNVWVIVHVSGSFGVTSCAMPTSSCEHPSL